MNNLTKIYNEILKRKSFQREVEKAKEQFKFKPFMEEYRPLKNMALTGRWFLAVFSIVTGWGFLFGSMSGALPYWMAGTIAGGLLLFIEMLKNFFVGVSVRGWYSNGKPPLLGLLALAVFGLSVFFSLQGVQTLYKSLDNRLERFETVSTVQADSIGNHYKTLSDSLKAELRAFKKSVEWMGQINMSNPDVSRTVGNFSKQLERLEVERSERLGEHARTVQASRAEIIEQGEFDLGLWVGLSALVEILILASLWFMVYYAYRVQSETELFTESEHKFWVGMEDLRGFAGLVLASDSGAFSLPEHGGGEPAQIGFNRGINKGIDKGINTADKEQPKNAENSEKGGINRGINKGINTPSKRERELREFLGKYSHVVADLNNGFSISKCVKKHGVSKSTVQNVKRVLRTLEAYK